MAHVLAKDLRDAVLQAAIQGKLTEQLETDTSVAETLKEIAKEKAQLVKQKKIRKSKSSSLIQENEKLYDIPYNWSWCRLKDVTYNFGQKKPESKFCYIDVSSINSDKHCLNRLETVVEPSDASSRARKIVVDGDVIFATIRPYLKNICIIDKQFTHQPIVSTAFAVMHCGKGLNNKYLFYYLLSASFMSFVNSGNNSKGVAYPAISENKFFDGLIAFPPIEEQARIVAKVDEIMAKIDEYENLENQLVKLKEQFPQDMKDSLLQAGMMGKLTEQLESDTIVDETSSFNTLDEERFDIPKAWTWFNLKDLMSICTGKKDQNFATRDGAYNFYTCAKEVFKAPNYSFEGESLILPGNGANVGTVTLYNGKFEAYQRTYVLQSINKTINMKFMYYCLLENWNQYNKNKMFGSAIPYIKLGNLQNYPVALPPIEEQQRIVDKLDDLLPLVDKLAELN